MATLQLASDTLAGTPTAGQVEYNGQYYGTDSNASRAQFERLVQGTAQATTSGTTPILFTGIPAWAKRITVMFSGVSTNGTTNWTMQVGSGSLTTTGYAGGSISAQSASVSSAGAPNSTSFIINTAVSNAAYAYHGKIELINFNGNTWVESGILAEITAARGSMSGGSITLSGALDRISISSITPDTWDAGSINIMYEG